MLMWLLIVLLLTWLVLFRSRRRRMYQLADLIPGSENSLPLIGIAHKLVGTPEDIMVSLQNFSYEAMKEGIITCWVGLNLYFMVVDPVDLEMILKTCLEKENLYRFLRNVTGNGTIFAPVPIWRPRRKVLVPAFAPKIVESFVEVFSEQSEVLVKRLDSEADSGSFSVWPFISTYTFDSVCDAVMGVKMNAQSNPDSPELNAMNRILHLVCERVFHLWLHPDCLYKMFTQKYNEYQKHIKTAYDCTNEIIRKKRHEIKSEECNKSEVEVDYNLGLYQKKSFLDLLIIHSGGEKGYTDVELREEILTLATAGTDTSGVTIGFTLLLLSKYPEVQDRVYQELLDVFGDSDRPVVKEDLLNLKYLERVVKESLRLYPPVPLIIRTVLEDTKLPSGRVLPAGSGVTVSIWGVHRDPKYWGPDAETFDPDRFLPERFKPVHACSYMPFSNGPRNCIGLQFALMSVKSALSCMLRRFRVVGVPEKSSTPHIRVKLDIMMKAVNGYEVALERRKPVCKVPNGNGVPNGNSERKVNRISVPKLPNGKQSVHHQMREL